MIIRMQKIIKSTIIVFLILFIFLFEFLSASENINYEKKFKKAKKMTVETMDRIKYNGYLLATNDSLLVFWRVRDVYNPDKINDFCKKFKYSDINQIKIERKFNPVIMPISFLSGIILGGCYGYYIRTIEYDPDDLDPGSDLAIPIFAFYGSGLGGLVGIVWAIVDSIDPIIKINGDSKKYKSIQKKLQRKAIFNNYQLSEELRTYIEKNR